jgi:hypothetical protein
MAQPAIRLSAQSLPAQHLLTAQPEHALLQPAHGLPMQRLPLVWCALLLLTLLSYYGLNRFSERSAVLLVLAAMWLKGQLLIDHFMGLRQVRGFWRVLMALYVFGVTLAIGLAFLLD